MTRKQLHAEWMRFRRNCRLVLEDGRPKKAWRSPGTPESGKEAMYSTQYNSMQR